MFYSDYDENTNIYCVFHTDMPDGFAYASYASEEEAEKNAIERNNMI